jgi:hypothetical protein
VFTTCAQIQEALSRVGRCLALADAGEYALLICGGSALSLAGLLDRPTRDVDVLGLVKGAKEAAVVPELLPDEIMRAARLVAVDLNLPVDWLNDAALAIQRLGLPTDLLKRARRLEFGPCLTVYVTGRQDQVALKLYAALDRQKGRRHLQDLSDIDPTRAELKAAVHWLLDRKTSLEFRRAIRQVCQTLGFRELPSGVELKSKSLRKVKKSRPSSTASANAGQRPRPRATPRKRGNS